MHLKLDFTVNFAKSASGKDDTQPPFSTVDHGALKSSWQQTFQLQSALDTVLRGMGIPLSQLELVNDQKFKVTVVEKEGANWNDLLMFADTFHVAKFLIKHEAYAQGFDVGFVPTDG